MSSQRNEFERTRRGERRARGRDRTGAPDGRRCGTMPVHCRLLTTSAAYRAAPDAIETETFTVLGSGAARPLALDEPVRIPVVVHVVWNTEEQNVEDTQVKSQLDVLTADFRMRNADVGAVLPPFAGLVADARVEFVLASEDRTARPPTAAPGRAPTPPSSSTTTR